MRKILLAVTILFMILLTSCKYEKSEIQQDAGLKQENVPERFLSVETSAVVKSTTLENLFPKEKQDLLLAILGEDGYKKLEGFTNKLKWYEDMPYVRIEADIPGKYYSAVDNSFTILDGDNGFFYLYSPEIGYRTNDTEAMFHAPSSLKVNPADEIEAHLIKLSEAFAAKYDTDQAEKQQESISILNTYSILDYTAGDLDGDSSPELAIVVEYINKEFTGCRQVYLLSKQAHDQYAIVNYNPYLIRGKGEGGIYGDPYQGIHIKDRVLSIDHYGGSNWRWAFQYRFAYTNNELKLIQVIESSIFLGTGNGTNTIYDFEDSSLKYYATYLEEPKEKLIYSSYLPEKSYLFGGFRSDAGFGELLPLKCLPDLGWYEYDTGKMIETASEPNDILDLVKKTYYPDLEKVNFTWTEDTKKNYESVCFFKVPDYFYCKNDRTLEYWKVESINSGGPQHMVLYSDNDPEGDYFSEFYYYDDKTGELER